MSTNLRAAAVRLSVPGSAADYDIVIDTGALARIGELAHDVVSERRFAVIADDAVAALHAGTVLRSLGEVGTADLLTFPAGEASKTRENWAALSDALLARGFGRDTCVVALGGGVSGDLAGFVAATFLRGVPVIQVPTSLLAMIDASIGGKTGVDTAAGKNLIGAFHSPRAVLIDTAVLDTLPEHELRNGLAEAIKHGAIKDAAYLAWIGEAADDLIRRDPPSLRRLIRRSVEIKAAVVQGDPLEAGERAILNFGHTAAHAIERSSGYDVPHGRAVAMGMVIEARLGQLLGVTEPGTARELCAVLESAGLPVRSPAGLDPAALLAATATDKKTRDARVRWSLIARPGVPARGPSGEWTLPAPPETALRAFAS